MSSWSAPARPGCSRRSHPHGRALAGRGVLDSALVVTAEFSRSEGFGWDTQTEWALAPLEVARIAEALGDLATARAALQTLLDRWQGADPDLRILADARSSLLRLQRGQAAESKALP